MNNNFTQTELLIQYLDGELEGESLAAIEKAIAADPSVANELSNLQLTSEAVKSYGLKNKISTLHAEMMQEIKTTTPAIAMRTKLYRYGMRIAAGLIILLGISGVYQYFNISSSEKIFEDNFQPFVINATRGAAVSSLEDSYQNQDMKSVIAQFDSISNPSVEDYFLAGNAFLVEKQPANAIKVFKALQQKNKTDHTNYFEEDVEYYLALAYLQNKEPAKAIPFFEKIHGDESHPYFKKVTNGLLRKLHRL